MRYIADSSGYLQEVSFGAEITCGGQSCAEYTGSVPSGHDSLEAWYIAECETLYRWKIVDGELVEDTSAVEPVENDLYVGPRARLRTTADGRGNLQLFKADGTLAVNAYANSGDDAGGEVDICNASGATVASLWAGVSGTGYLRLKDADGNAQTLTAELIANIGSGSGVSGGVSITKLWENASPTSAFAAQTIALDLSGYDWVLVFAAPQTQYQWMISQICPVGTTGLLTYGWGDDNHPGHRAFTVSTTKIDFDSAYYNGKVSTNQIIPVLILGIKGVT